MKSASKLIAVIVLVVVAAVISVNLIFYTGSTSKSADALLTWQEQYDLGMRYLVESDYEAAIVAFTAAIKIDSKNTEAYIGRAEAYLAYDDSDESIQSAVSDYSKAISLGAANEDIYVKAADAYLLLGDYESARAILEKGISASVDSGLISGKVLHVNHARTAKEKYVDKLVNLRPELENIAETLSREDWFGDELRSFIKELGEKLVYKLDNGEYLEMYPTGFVYLGEKSHGVRSGHGLWFRCYQHNVTVNAKTKVVTRVFEGEWSNDYPNGSGKYYRSTIVYEDGMQMPYACISEINFINGAADGEGTSRKIRYRYPDQGSELEKDFGYSRIVAVDGILQSPYDDNVTPSEKRNG